MNLINNILRGGDEGMKTGSIDDKKHNFMEKFYSAENKRMLFSEVRQQRTIKHKDWKKIKIKLS